jgi:hypothetical protein
MANRKKGQKEFEFWCLPTICITLQMWFAGKYYFVGNHTVQAISILASSLFLAVSACLFLPDVYHTYLVKRSEGIYNYLLISDSITSDQVYQLECGRLWVLATIESDQRR